MKKKLTALLAGVMMLAMTTTAFGASPVAGTTVGKSTDKNGVEVTVSQTAATAAVEAEAKTEAAKVANATVVATFELSAPAGTVFPVTVTINATGITATDTVKVLHKASTGWETLDAKAGNGTVTFTTNSMSPFSIVKIAKASASTSSPKTGETAPVLPIALVLVAGLGVALVSKKAIA